MNQFETWATFNINGAYLDKYIDKKGVQYYDNHIVQAAWQAWETSRYEAMKEIEKLRREAFSQGEKYAQRELHKNRYVAEARCYHAPIEKEKP